MFRNFLGLENLRLFGIYKIQIFAAGDALRGLEDPLDECIEEGQNTGPNAQFYLMHSIATYEQMMIMFSIEIMNCVELQFVWRSRRLEFDYSCVVGVLLYVLI